MKDERIIVLRGKPELERALIAISAIQLDPKFPFEIAIRKHKIKRSIEQNKRYHAVCSEIAEQLVLNGKQYDPDVLKEYFKRLFIGSTEIEMPDGTTEIHGISTTTLSVGEFADYMTKIDRWAAEHCIILEETRGIMSTYHEEARRWREREQRKEKAS